MPNNDYTVSMKWETFSYLLNHTREWFLLPDTHLAAENNTKEPKRQRKRQRLAGSVQGIDSSLLRLRSGQVRSE